MTVESLYRLVNRLSDEEVMRVGHFTRALYGQPSHAPQVLLLEHLLQARATLSIDAWQEQTAKQPKTWFSWAYNLIIDYLLLHESLQQADFREADVPNWTRIDLARDMQKADMLHQLGLRSDAFELYRQIIVRASSASLHDVQLNAERMCQRIDTTSAEKYTPAIRVALEQYQLHIESEIAVHEIAALSDISMGDASKARVEQIKYALAEHIDAIASRLEAVSSPRSQAHLLHLQYIQLGYMDGDQLPKRQQILAAKEQLFHQYPLLYSRQFIQNLRAEQVDLALAQLDFEQATLLLMSARQAYPSATPAQLLPIYLQQLRLLLYLGNYAQVVALVEQVEPTTHAVSLFNKRQPETLRYLAVCAHILAGNISPARKQLQTLTYLWEDKSGVSKHLRTIEILIAIESGDVDLASARIESQRKYLKQYFGEGRDMYINLFFRALERNAFSFESTSADMMKYLTEIKKTKWDALSLECINIAVWFEAKLRQQPYATCFDEYVAVTKPRT